MKRALILCAFVLFPFSVFARDAFLAIGGSVGSFRTDMRVFNPSTSKDIQIQATFLPVNVGVSNGGDNRQAQAVTLNVPKRQMVTYDDVVRTLFNADAIGAIHLKSADDFVATQRIYAIQAPTPACQIAGTLGQFVQAVDLSAAKSNGVLIQLKANASYRTNVGLVNPGAVPASVTFKLYDRNNQLVSTGAPIQLPSLGVVGPTTIAGSFFFTPGSADLSDAWVSFVSDQPVIAYASVIDNGTGDPTFINMSVDSGTTTAPPPAPQTKTYDVTLRSFQIIITPTVELNSGDTAIFRITTADSTHGFELDDPAGKVLIPSFTLTAGAAPVSKTVSITTTGTFNYFCTRLACGSGHGNMAGTFVVGDPSGDRPGY